MSALHIPLCVLLRDGCRVRSATCRAERSCRATELDDLHHTTGWNVTSRQQKFDRL